MTEVTYKTKITYVDEETGELIEKEDFNQNYILVNKIKENAKRQNSVIKIQWTYIGKRTNHLSLDFGNI